MGQCEVKGCGNDGIFDYGNHSLCWVCWERHLDKNDSLDLRSEFDIDPAIIMHDRAVDIQAELNEILERGKLWRTGVR